MFTKETSFLEKIHEITGHAAAVYTVDGTGDSLYTGSGDHFVARWNLVSGQQDAFSIQADASIYSLKLVNQATQLVFGLTTGAIHVVDLANKTELRHFVQHRTAIFAIAENPALQHIYTSDADGNLAIWKSDSWDLLLFLPLQTGKIRDIQLYDNGQLMLLAAQDGTIRIFETRGYNEISAFQAHAGGANCLHPIPGKPGSILSGGKDGHLRVWKDEKEILAIPAHNFGIYRIVFLANGKYFVTASRDKTIKLWDAQTFQVLERIERKHGGHSHAVNDLYKSGENSFVSVGDDKRIISWELKVQA
jgi:WD40 repeat protein